MALRTVNPTTGQVLGEHPELGDDELRTILAQAAEAFATWRNTSFADRAARLAAAAGQLERRREALARLLALEMGKPLTQGRAEVDKCAWVCRHFAEHAERLLAPEPAATEATRSYVAFRPLGPVLAVMPWNFPLWQLFRCAAPALMAGNVVLLKHASNVTGSALAIEQLLHAAEVPVAAFRTLPVSSARVGALIDAPEVVAVALTGGTPAGRAVAARAGAALKKTVLELGGSDPYVVLEDADLEAAAAACATARLVNAGQSCIAAKRFVVVEPVRQRFTELLLERLRAAKVGDPLADGTTVGPLAREDLRAELHDQVERSVRAGARLRLGGTLPEGPGWFYPPTLLDDVRPGMAAFDEETFGPVAAVVPAGDEAEALRLANATPFGLGAAVFTRDAARGERIAAEQLEAGSCVVNDFVRSDPRLPFGGIKGSGWGRELGAFGIREFVNIKTVVVR